MKPWIMLIAGVVLVITPQIIVGVVAANTAWVQSSYLRTLGLIESHGGVATERVAVEALPGMPVWMLAASMLFGVLLCVIGVVLMIRASSPAHHAMA